ncbi:hypothetical protein ACJX0J_022932, partial [Zea mays]
HLMHLHIRKRFIFFLHLWNKYIWIPFPAARKIDVISAAAEGRDTRAADIIQDGHMLTPY